MPSTYFCEVCLSSTIRIQTTRGLLILVARLSAREHKRIFSLCHYFAIMKRGSENECRHLGQNEMAGLKGQKRPSRQHERLQARAEIFCINSSRVISPFSINSFASASVCARLETSSS